MSDNQCDALVFFGATGDLAYKMIFPSPQAMIKRGTLNIPIIGVAKSGWSLDGLQERARRTIECRRAAAPRSNARQRIGSPSGGGITRPAHHTVDEPVVLHQAQDTFSRLSGATEAAARG